MPGPKYNREIYLDYSLEQSEHLLFALMILTWPQTHQPKDHQKSQNVPLSFPFSTKTPSNKLTF